MHSPQGHSEDLTLFQRESEKRVKELASELHMEVRNRQVRWIGEPAIQAELGPVAIWIYVDEAEILGDEINYRFETYDYSTPHQLTDAFITRLSSLLQRRL